jgi:hypothetical protein
MDSRSDDEISTIAFLNNEFYWKHFFGDWSDLESDDDSYLMAAEASILYEENEVYMPQWRGSSDRPSHQSRPQPRGQPCIAVR